MEGRVTASAFSGCFLTFEPCDGHIQSWLFGFGGGQQPNAESTEEKGEEADSNGEDDSFSSNDDADQDASTFQPAALKPLTPPPEIQEVLRHAKQQQP